MFENYNFSKKYLNLIAEVVIKDRVTERYSYIYQFITKELNQKLAINKNTKGKIQNKNIVEVNQIYNSMTCLYEEFENIKNKMFSSILKNMNRSERNFINDLTEIINIFNMNYKIFLLNELNLNLLLDFSFKIEKFREKLYNVLHNFICNKDIILDNFLQENIVKYDNILLLVEYLHEYIFKILHILEYPYNNNIHTVNEIDILMNELKYTVNCQDKIHQLAYQSLNEMYRYKDIENKNKKREDLFTILSEIYDNSRDKHIIQESNENIDIKDCIYTSISHIEILEKDDISSISHKIQSIKDILQNINLIEIDNLETIKDNLNRLILPIKYMLDVEDEDCSETLHLFYDNIEKLINGIKQLIYNSELIKLKYNFYFKQLIKYLSKLIPEMRCMHDALVLLDKIDEVQIKLNSMDNKEKDSIITSRNITNPNFTLCDLEKEISINNELFEKFKEIFGIVPEKIYELLEGDIFFGYSSCQLLNLLTKLLMLKPDNCINNYMDRKEFLNKKCKLFI